MGRDIGELVRDAELADWGATPGTGNLCASGQSSSSSYPSTSTSL
jgi:hypothetical protein